MRPTVFVLACPNIWQDVTSSASAQCNMFMSLKKEITTMILVQSRRFLAQYVQYIYPNVTLKYLIYIYPNVTLKYLISSKILIALLQKSPLTFPLFLHH
jgi:hypothetical protein